MITVLQTYAKFVSVIKWHLLDIYQPLAGIILGLGIFNMHM